MVRRESASNRLHVGGDRVASRFDLSPQLVAKLPLLIELRLRSSLGISGLSKASLKLSEMRFEPLELLAIGKAQRVGAAAM